jgi:uncharacterized protein
MIVAAATHRLRLCERRVWKESGTMTIAERIQKDIADAMRARAELRLSALRMMKTAIKNKEIEKRSPLTDPESEATLSTLIKQRRDSAEQFRKGGREEMAQKEEAEITIIEQYLPAPATEDDMNAAVEAAIAETGATSAKQMGLVMKAATAKLAGKRVDGRAVSEKVKARLS